MSRPLSRHQYLPGSAEYAAIFDRRLIRIPIEN